MRLFRQIVRSALHSGIFPNQVLPDYKAVYTMFQTLEHNCPESDPDTGQNSKREEIIYG